MDDGRGEAAWQEVCQVTVAARVWTGHDEGSRYGSCCMNLKLRLVKAHFGFDSFACLSLIKQLRFEHGWTIYVHVQSVVGSWDVICGEGCQP